MNAPIRMGGSKPRSTRKPRKVPLDLLILRLAGHLPNPAVAGFETPQGEGLKVLNPANPAVFEPNPARVSPVQESVAGFAGFAGFSNAHTEEIAQLVTRGNRRRPPVRPKAQLGKSGPATCRQRPRDRGRRRKPTKET